LIDTLNANRSWVVWLAVGMIAISMGFMLWIPVIPVGDAEGGIARIPRAEFWLILVASLETIWNQWTAGGMPTISDRFKNLGCACLWMVAAFYLGRPVCRWDQLERSLGRWAVAGICVACGSAAMALCVLLNGLTFGLQSRLGLMVWLAGAVGLGFWWNSRIPKPNNEKHLDARLEGDVSFSESWARRLMGLTVLGIIWVLALTLAGSSIPSYDADVREHQNTASRLRYLAEDIGPLEHLSHANGPQGTAMPMLFWMNVLIGQPTEPMSIGTVQTMIDASLIRQTIQCLQWFVALGLLVSALSKAYGYLASILTVFAIASHPGLFELVRLGGGAGEGGMWLIAAAALMFSSQSSTLPIGSLTCIGLGAASHSLVLGMLVTFPFLLTMAFHRGINPLRRIVLFISIVAVVVFFEWVWGRGGGWDSDWVARQFPFFFMPWWQAGQGGLEAGARIVWNSLVHSLHLVPLALLGIIVRRDRAARDAAIGFGLWCLLWWIGTAQQDRDWVIAIPLLAWPMANGIAWLLDRRQRLALSVIGGIPLIWSVVVLCAWPTSDNRILVPLNVLAPIVPAGERAGEGRGKEAEDLALSVNQIWIDLDQDKQKERWLLVGSADAFRWLPNVALAGEEAWGTEGLRFLVFDWAGLRNLDQVTGIDRSSVYRDRIQQWQRVGVLRPVAWDLSSSQAQCFEVVNE
jgi:hypothetical protein